jgi:hypothetical protein
MILQKLSIDSIYPLPINEGITASFLLKSGNVLQLGLHHIDQQELLALKKHPIKCGLYIDLPVILWLFDFGDGGQYDVPFNAKLYSRDQLQLYDITNAEQRLAIEMHVVEMKNKATKVLRLFTLPPALSLAFLSAVQDQLAQSFDLKHYQTKLAGIYQIPLENLLKRTTLYSAGT